MYFKSLCDDNKRRLSGVFHDHRLRQKRLGRLKHVSVKYVCLLRRVAVNKKFPFYLSLINAKCRVGLHRMRTQ